MKKAALIVNTKSRRGAESFVQAKKLLIEGGLELVAAKSCKNPKDIVPSVQSQIEAGTPLIVVGGGDGTLGAVSSLFSHQEAVMGVLPLGTGNAFARDLQIRPTVEHACEVILGGETAHIDLGHIEGRSFVNVATIGLTTRIALGLNNDAKKRFGRAVYLFSIFRALATVKPFHVRLDHSGGVSEFESLQVVIGNGRFHAGPFPVAPDASIDGGWLSVYALATTQKSAFLKLALHLWGGRQVDLDEVHSFRIQEGRIETWPPRRITTDGEVCLKTPATFRVLPGALKVKVPPQFLTS